VRQFTDAFFRDIVHGICGDIANFLLLRKRLQSGYLIQMKDLAMETWQREGWRMFRQQKAAEIGQENTNDFSIPV
jgi:hypothetical protein